MSITVIKEGSVLRVLQCTSQLPDGTELTLFTKEEIHPETHPKAWDAAQLDSIFSEDEDWGDSLDTLVHPDSTTGK